MDNQNMRFNEDYNVSDDNSETYEPTYHQAGNGKLSSDEDSQDEASIQMTEEEVDVDM